MASNSTPALPQDRDRLIKLLGMLGSEYDGEVLSAGRRIEALRRTAGISWADVLIGSREMEVATEAARLLAEENVLLRARLEELEVNGSAVAAWQPLDLSNHRAAAQWALDLHIHGIIWLASKEVDFLHTCTRWRGALRPRQRAWFEPLIERIAHQSGQTPPP